MKRQSSHDRAVLSDFADLYQFCSVCLDRGWSCHNLLHIHHLVGGAGRKHDRRNLLRLCERCHGALHDGGREYGLTKAHCLTAKRLVDDGFYDPEFLASLKHKRHLGYDPEPFPFTVLEFRKRNFQEYYMPINSRAKGKAGELEAKDEVNRVLPLAHARRSQQHSGAESAADLIAPGLPNLWLEVKRVEKLNLESVMAKAKTQCGSLHPVILHRKNGGEWLVTFRLDDVIAVSDQFLDAT